MVINATSKKYITISQIHTKQFKHTPNETKNRTRCSLTSLHIHKFLRFQNTCPLFQRRCSWDRCQYDDQAAEWATGQSGFDSRQQNTRVLLWPPQCPGQLVVYLASKPLCTLHCSQGQNWWCVKLINDLHTVSTLRRREAIPPLSYTPSYR